MKGPKKSENLEVFERLLGDLEKQKKKEKSKKYLGLVVFPKTKTKS